MLTLLPNWFSVMNVNAFILGLVVGIFPRNLARFISHAMIFLHNPQMVLEDWPIVVVCIFPLPVQVSSIYCLKMAVTEKEAKEQNFRDLHICFNFHLLTPSKEQVVKERHLSITLIQSLLSGCGCKRGNTKSCPDSQSFVTNIPNVPACFFACSKYLMPFVIIN